MNAVRARLSRLAQPGSALFVLLLSIPAGAQTPVYRQPGSAYTTRAMRGAPLPEARAATPERRVITKEVASRPATPAKATKTSPVKKAEAPSTYVVRPGDTLSDIALRHGLTTDALRAANGLTHDTLRIGQTLSLKPGRLPVPNGADAYVVQPDDSFNDIALRYGVHPDDLARANPTVYPDRLLIGETLKIPAKTAAPAASTAATASSPSPDKAVAAVAVLTHVVAPGESLGAIAKRHGISTATLVAANGLKNPNHIVTGQRLIVPTAAPAVAPAPAAEPPAVVPAPTAVAAVEPAVESPEPAVELAAAPSEPAFTVEPENPAPFRAAAPRGIMAYLLEPGDDLPKLAARFGTTVEQLRTMNKLPADRQLSPGDEIIVPAAGSITLN
jgi:LysM repeat protein